MLIVPGMGCDQISIGTSFLVQFPASVVQQFSGQSPHSVRLFHVHGANIRCQVRSFVEIVFDHTQTSNDIVLFVGNHIPCRNACLRLQTALHAFHIFTIGASSAAFYYSYTKCIRQKQGYAWKTFFQSFKSNFKQSTPLWLLVLGILLFAVLDNYLLGTIELSALWADLIRTIIFASAIFCILWALYLFPYISRFEISSKAAMKNCALIALANFPWSLLLLLLFAVCAFGFVCLPLLNLFIPSVYMFFANKILENIFQKYMSPEDLAAQTPGE